LKNGDIPADVAVGGFSIVWAKLKKPFFSLLPILPLPHSNKLHPFDLPHALDERQLNKSS